VKIKEAGFGKVTSGSYTGNGTANRAIPHGLGRKPKYVKIQNLDINVQNELLAELGLIFVHLETSFGRFTITDMDTVYFYVGNTDSYNNSGNGLGCEYYWVAFG